MDPLGVDLLADLALQSFAFPEETGIDVQVGLGESAAGTFVSTLVIGAIMIALAPDYTENRMRAVREDPAGSVVAGVLFLVALVLLVFVLAITIIGILFAIPLVIVAVLVWAVGAAIAFLAIAEELVDADDWVVSLVVAAAMNAALTLTGIGGLVSFVVGAAGFGAVLRHHLG